VRHAAAVEGAARGGLPSRRDALYNGDRRRLREELARIRFALESTPAAEDARHWQAAA